MDRADVIIPLPHANHDFGRSCQLRPLEEKPHVIGRARIAAPILTPVLAAVLIAHSFDDEMIPTARAAQNVGRLIDQNDGCCAVFRRAMNEPFDNGHVVPFVWFYRSNSLSSSRCSAKRVSREFLLPSFCSQVTAVLGSACFHQIS